MPVDTIIAQIQDGKKVVVYPPRRRRQPGHKYRPCRRGPGRRSSAGRPMSAGARLAVRGLTKRFGGLLAVNQLQLRGRGRQVVGLIGPNGSGKSTVFNLITNLLRADAGSVLHDGAPHRRAASCTTSRDAASAGPSRK